ncbi:unnamed protein product [Didymodactylos carnosus]|uniref:Uncharacterized protein n=1 Tax=Didymodactylos carnosus TaxID=1234261 RepID=A0A815FZX5_9BILA|nr:unnamed protein product [Didymodactylos carnosus]CAF4186886.1 unnamed protein product [Didymodactylos carnosus]
MWFLEKYENLIVTFECSYSLPRYCTLSAEFIDRHAATFASWYGGVWTNLFVIDQNLPIWLIEKHADLIPWEDLYPHSGRESQNDIFCESFARKHADRRIWQNIGHFAVSNEFVMEHIEKMNLFRDLDEICARDGNRHSISGTTSWSSLLDNGTTLTQSVFIDMLEKGEMSIITACAWIKHRQLESHILKQLLSKYENNKSNHRGYKQILSKALEHQKSMTTSEMLHTYTASMNKKLMKSLLNNPSFNLDTFKTELIKSHDCGVCCEFAEKLTKQIQNKRISDKE